MAVNEWRDKEFIAAVQKAAQEGVDSGAAIMQNTMIAELQHPGSGRFYVRSKAAKKAIRKLGGMSKWSEASADAVQSYMSTKNAKREAKGKNPLSLREAGIHQASAPGEPPATDTGMLSRVQIDRTGMKAKDKPEAMVGTDHDYGFFLEFGTRKIQPRPWARPSLDIAGKEVRQAIVNSLAAAVKGFGT